MNSTLKIKAVNYEKMCFTVILLKTDRFNDVNNLLRLLSDIMDKD